MKLSMKGGEQVKRLTVTLDDSVGEDLERKAQACGVSEPTLARLVISYWTRGQLFQDPAVGDLQEAA